jgi:predicted dehydrogenase
LSQTRRIFLFGALGGALTTRAARRDSPNNRIRIAILGVHGRGRDHISGFGRLPDVEIAMLCDPDAEVLAKRAASVEGRFGRKVAAHQDLCRAFDSKDIDAVTIATPNHWHALAAIWACQAGKDVYVEKPASHNIFEGRQLVEAARRYERIVQHGVQLRSSEALQEGVDLLRGGAIGKVYMARGMVFRRRPSIGNVPEEPAPASLNWDLWQGPAQARPFSRRYVHYNWHWNWEYGNGDIGNQGIHETDMCMWGLGVGLPSRISAAGGKFLFEDDKETPEVLTTTYTYPNQKKMIQFEVRHWCTNDEHGVEVGNIFYGSEGIMVVKGYDSFAVYLGRRREAGPRKKAGGNHWANFIKAVRSRRTSDQNAPVETGHLSSALAHLGNIGYRLGRTLEFDPEKERFVADEEANRMLTRNYRAPYVVPERV